MMIKVLRKAWRLREEVTSISNDRMYEANPFLLNALTGPDSRTVDLRKGCSGSVVHRLWDVSTRITVTKSITHG